MFRRKVVGLSLLGALFGGSVALTAPPAAALDNVLCNAAGNVFVTHPSGTINLAVNGTGRCAGGDSRGPYLLTMSGFGHATPLTGCGSGLPLVTKFNVPLHLHLASVTLPGYSKDFDIVWSLVVDTFPRISAYTVRYNGHLVGAGTVFTAASICEGDLNSSGALFDFDFISKLLGSPILS